MATRSETVRIDGRGEAAGQLRKIEAEIGGEQVLRLDRIAAAARVAKHGADGVGDGVGRTHG